MLNRPPFFSQKSGGRDHITLAIPTVFLAPAERYSTCVGLVICHYFLLSPHGPFGLTKAPELQMGSGGPFVMTKHACLKKNPMSGPTFCEMVGPVMGFCVSAKHAMQMADLAEKCIW